VIVHVKYADDIETAHREDRLGIIFGCQGLDSKIEGDPSLLLIMRELGQRIVQLMYNERSREARGLGMDVSAGAKTAVALRRAAG
jgi:microsomal dipeptidase-like Zn-dependent dipeptidase